MNDDIILLTYNKGLIKGYTILADKITDKIKQLRKKTGNIVTDEINEIIIKVLQELLEEE